MNLSTKFQNAENEIEAQIGDASYLLRSVERPEDPLLLATGNNLRLAPQQYNISFETDGVLPEGYFKVRGFMITRL